MRRTRVIPSFPHLFIPSRVLRLCLPVVLLLTLSCRRGPLPGAADLPPGVARVPGVFLDVGPRWSPDGKRIAFLRWTTDRRHQLFVASADLSRVTPLREPMLVSPDRAYPTERAGHRTPEGLAWSPDGRKIAFARVEWFPYEDGERLPGMGLWACDLKTGRVEPLAIHPKNYQGDYYYFRAPQWSPDGKRVAFIGEGIYGESALFIRTLPGTEPQVRTPDLERHDDIGWPAWSPDGRRLAFRQGRLRALTADPVETLRSIAPGRAETRRLLTRPRARVAGLAWSPDGAQIAFALTSDVSALQGCAIWVVDADGRGPARRVSPDDGRGYLAPVWIDARTLGALRPLGTEWEAVALPLRGGPLRVLCRLPSSDIDWSPDRRRIVCAMPSEAKPGASTTLRVFSSFPSQKP